MAYKVILALSKFENTPKADIFQIPMSDQPDSIYEFVTEETLQNFEGSGTESLLQILQRPDLSAERAADTASGVFTELLMLFDAEQLDIESVSEFLALAITDESKAAVFCQVFDVFPHGERLKELLVYLYEKKQIIKPATLAQYLDPELLVQLQIVPRTSLYRQLNTHKRDEFYTQKKFNLFHEEFEGYTKLINEVYSVLKSADKMFQVAFAVQAVEQMIGHYRLDPNRVLDVLLDIFINCIVGNHRFVIQFLKASRWWPSTSGNCNSLETLNVGGSETATNCLALRLAKYPADKELPVTLKATIAILIKEGFISFGSLYNFWRRSPDEMVHLEEVYKKELEEKVFKASASALALAAPLMDDEEEEDASKSSVPLDQAKKSKEKDTCASLIRHNFEFQMLKSFLGNGLYWPAIYILSKYPFLVYVDPEVPELMHRLLATIIQSLYSSISPFTELELAIFQQEKSIANSRPMNKVQYENPILVSVYGSTPTVTVLGNKKLTYFYTEWSDGIPVASSTDDLLRISRDFIKFFGVELASDLGNFSKLCDIIVTALKSDASETNLDKWFTYFRNYIFPAIGSISNNSIPVDKAYEVMKIFKPEERFNLYGELYQVLAKNNPHVKIFYGKAEKATKDLLKRLSKENVLPMMRRLAKISFSNPLPCFLTILQQIESYDNLNNLVVEAAGYFNEYGWDNLTLAILMRLSATGRASIQADGLNERQWIQSLASFVGKICLKYPEKVELQVILQYLLKSFHANETSGLLVLKEMLCHMGGIQAITNLTHLQINLINCGSCLKKIVYSTIGDERFERQISGKALCKTLFDHEIVNELLIVLCKLNGSLISGSDHSHPKVLANKNDDLDAVLHLFCTLISVFGDTYSAKKLLSISSLVEEYGVPIPWAFELWRNYLGSDESGELETILTSNNNSISVDGSTNLFVTFWKLKLYDLNYSESLFQSELDKLRGKVTSLKESISFARRDKDTTKEKLMKLTSDLKLTEEFITSIPSEQSIHAKHSQLMVEVILLQSVLWFASNNIDELKLITTNFLQNCILPRAIHSSFDATYSAEFLFTLHKLNTVNFSLLLALTELFSSRLLFGTLFTCTPTEAENLGIFYSSLLTKLNSWTKASSFESEVSHGTLFTEESPAGVSLSEFRLTVFNYHKDLLEDVTKSLAVEEYMSRRNAIIYLKNLLGIYPTVEDHCEAITEAIENVAKNDSRDDLKLSSSALIGHVKSRASTWIHIWDFIDMDDESKAKQVGKRDVIKQAREKARQLELKAKQEAEKKAQEEELKRLRERQEKAARERELERSTQAQAASITISYDDAQPRSERAHARTNDSARGRYDKYSTSANDHAHTRPVGPQAGGVSTTAKASRDSSGVKPATVSKPLTKPPSKPSPKSSPKPVESSSTKDIPGNSRGGPVTPSTRPPVNSNLRPPNNSNTRPPANSSASRNTERPSVPTNAVSHTSKSLRDLPRDNRPRQPQPAQDDLFLKRVSASKAAPPPRSINANIKAKISEGKKEYRENNTASDNNRTRSVGSASHSNTSSRSLTPAAIPPPPAPPVASKRAPLPPQQPPSRGGYGGHYNSQYRASSGSQQSSGPLPPPSLPPPKSDRPGDNGRYRHGSKRGYEGNSRYDKRQKY